MKELQENTVRLRDDSDTRALMLGSKACRDLELQPEHVDWQRFLDEIAHQRRQRHTESEIDWISIIRNCAMPSIVERKRSWHATLLDFFTYRQIAAEVVRVAVVVILLLFIWFNARERVSRLVGELQVLRQENDAIKQEYSQLQSEFEKANDSSEQTRRYLADEYKSLQEKLIQSRAGSRSLKREFTTNPATNGEDIAIRDASGLVTINKNGAVGLPDNTRPPAYLARLMSELATSGVVTNTKTVRDSLETLQSGETRGTGSSSPGQGIPIPISPVHSAIRSTTPLFRWSAISGAKHYRVTVSYPAQKDNGKVIWRSDPIMETLAALPPGIIKQGEVYFWQVEVVAFGKTGLSPAAGFWVIDHDASREIEATELRYKNSDLALAAVYEAHGLFEDALARIERLSAINPTNSSVNEMLRRLRRQLHRD